MTQPAFFHLTPHTHTNKPAHTQTTHSTHAKHMPTVTLLSHTHKYMQTQLKPTHSHWPLNPFRCLECINKGSGYVQTISAVDYLHAYSHNNVNMQHLVKPTDGITSSHDVSLRVSHLLYNAYTKSGLHHLYDCYKHSIQTLDVYIISKGTLSHNNSRTIVWLNEFLLSTQCEHSHWKVEKICGSLGWGLFQK